MKKILLICILCMGFLTAHAKLPHKKIVLSSDNTAVLWGPVLPFIVEDTIEQIRQLDSKLKSNYPIYLVIYSPGGYIDQGFTLINYIKSLHRPVHTITIFAASMAFQTVQQLGDRYILEYGVLMSHKAKGGFSGEFGDRVSQLDSRYGMWLRRIDRLDRHTVKRTKGKQTLKSYRAAYENELWLNGWEAVKQGYADSLAEISCSPGLSEMTRTLVVKRMMSKLLVSFDACPLNTNIVDIHVNIATNQGEMSLTDFVNKGGKISKDCKMNDTKTITYDGKVIINKKELCALNPNLSIKKLLNLKEKYKQMFSNIKGQTNKYTMSIR